MLLIDPWLCMIKNEAINMFDYITTLSSVYDFFLNYDNQYSNKPNKFHL